MSLLGTNQDLYKEAVDGGRVTEDLSMKVAYSDIFISPWCCDSSHEDRYEALVKAVHLLKDGKVQAGDAREGMNRGWGSSWRRRIEARRSRPSRKRLCLAPSRLGPLRGGGRGRFRPAPPPRKTEAFLF